MSHSRAYSSARSPSRLPTPTRATWGEAWAPGITFRLMLAGARIPHVTGASSMRPLLSRNGGDRDRHARLRVHGQGPFERVPDDRLHDVAPAARAAARRDRGP